MLKAMDRIFENGSIFDRYSVEQHLRALEAQALEVERLKGKDHEDAIKARARFNNDHIRLQIVMKDVEDDSTGDFLFYRSAHNGSTTGRIYAVGGFQSCSKEMKAAAFSRVEDVHNYDLVSSQVNGLIQQFEITCLDTSWLVDYRDTPNIKQLCADFIGISPDCWKTCLIALIMGAYLPLKASRGSRRKSAILENLYKEAGEDIDKAEELLRRFIICVDPLHYLLRVWHGWLLDIYRPTTAKNGRGGSYILNRCGKRLYLSSLPKARYEANRKVAAFILQGQESCFIHHLTLLDHKYGYRVIANEHDGVITIGEIPAEAVEEAAALSGLKNARLEEKPFVRGEGITRDAEDEAPAIVLDQFTGGLSQMVMSGQQDGLDARRQDT